MLQLFSIILLCNVSKWLWTSYFRPQQRQIFMGYFNKNADVRQTNAYRVDEKAVIICFVWSDDASRPYIYSWMHLSLMNDSPDHPETRTQPVVWNLCSPRLWLNRYECIWYSGSVIPSSVICHNYTLSGVTWLDKWQWHISPLSASEKRGRSMNVTCVCFEARWF